MIFFWPTYETIMIAKACGNMTFPELLDVLYFYGRVQGPTMMQ